jgi:hydroxypyruvate reductase
VNATDIRTDAEAIWTAAMRAVQPERLVADRLSLESAERMVCHDGQPLAHTLQLEHIDRIVVVGAGKAAAGLAAGIEQLLGPEGLASHRVKGLVSVPAGCGRNLSAVEVRETRPATANLPTPAVVETTHEILTMVADLGPRDLVIAVITGGGSALLAAPKEGISLAEKIAVTRRLSESGADIATLNAARRTMSLVKGGGLARACTAGHLLVLVLSDVIGDDLDVIASGPCMPSVPHAADGIWTTPTGCRVQHIIVGKNETAMAAARSEARQRGYDVQDHPLAAAGIAAVNTAEAVGRRLAAAGIFLQAATAHDGRPRALISGGEATVSLPADHGVGGRNQQTVLAAIDSFQRERMPWPAGLLIASVGTDGEDGPTDAAGGSADAAVVAAITTLGLDARQALARCDAYPLLDAAGGLIRTGPTGTNVADIRIVLARP